jgi:hypothetical protein
MAFASLMGVTALMIHSTVDFNLQITSNGMMFLIVMCLPYLVGQGTHASSRSRSMRNTTSAAGSPA